MPKYCRHAIANLVIACLAASFTAFSQVQASDAVAKAFSGHQTELFLQDSGKVVRILADDNDGSRHQRFIVETNSGITVLIVHNIDLAPRLDSLSLDEVVSFRGEYIWNAQGGLVHWTHHDPDKKITGGWLLYRGKYYR